MHVPGSPLPAGKKPYSLVRAIGWGVVLLVLGQAQGTCAERKNHPPLSGLEAPSHSPKNILFQGPSPHAMHALESPQPAGNKPYSLVRAIGWGVVLVAITFVIDISVRFVIIGVAHAVISGLSEENKCTWGDNGELEAYAEICIFFIFIAQCVCICAAVWLLVRYCRLAPVSDYLAFRAISWEIIMGTMVGSSVIILLYNLIQYRRKNVEIPIFNGETAAASWKLILSIGFLAPFFEEVLFRGLLFKDLERSWVGLKGAFLISAAFFSLSHLDVFITKNPSQNSGETGSANLSCGQGINIEVFCIRFFMGLLAAWAKYKTESLWAAVATHVAWNLTVLIVFKNHIHLIRCTASSMADILDELLAEKNGG